LLVEVALWNRSGEDFLQRLGMADAHFIVTDSNEWAYAGLMTLRND
jgi:hypothetical protein